MLTAALSDRASHHQRRVLDRAAAPPRIRTGRRSDGHLGPVGHAVHSRLPGARPIPGEPLEEAAGVVRRVHLPVAARPEPLGDVGGEGGVEVHHVGDGADPLLGHAAGEPGDALGGLGHPGVRVADRARRRVDGASGSLDLGHLRRALHPDAPLRTDLRRHGVEQGIGEPDDLEGLDVAPAAHVGRHQVAAVDLEHVPDAAVEVEAHGRPRLGRLELAAQLGLEPVAADLDHLEVLGMGLLGLARGRAQVDRTDRPHLLEHLAAPVRPVLRDQPVTERR